tara:strand:+ start:2400 stop:3179 length:780 start_codon:yes stop_codon:yes gene_type:complete
MKFEPQAFINALVPDCAGHQICLSKFMPKHIFRTRFAIGWMIFHLDEHWSDMSISDNAHSTSDLDITSDDAGDDDRALGQAIRRARQSARMSLQQVAESAGTSVGLLSQIERGISSPSIRVLREICNVLKIPVHALFGDSDAAIEQEARRVVRVNQRRKADFGAKGMIKEFLNAHEGRALQVMEIILEPNGGSGDDSYSHEGEECGVVLEGRLELHVDGAVYRLAEGDSFYFESTLNHKFNNISPGKTRIIWITTPPVW